MGMTAQALEIALLGGGIASLVNGMLPRRSGGGPVAQGQQPQALGQDAMDAADRALGQQWAANQQQST